MTDDRDSKTPSAPAGDKKTISQESKPISVGPPGSSSQRPRSGYPPKQPTLIGIPSPSVPARSSSVPPRSSSAPEALNSKPISRPPSVDGDEDWDASPGVVQPVSRPPMLSEREEEKWELAPTEPSKSSTAADSQRAAASDPNGKHSSGSSRIALFIAAAAVVGGAWFLVRSRGEPASEQPSHVSTAAPERATPEISSPVRANVEPTSAASVQAATAVHAEPSPSANASAAAANALAASAVATVEPQRGSEELIVVTVTTIPADARFFYKGKPVGRSPLRVELKPGQRRSFEIGHAGFYARKVVVDGSQREMKVSMRPEP